MRTDHDKTESNTSERERQSSLRKGSRESIKMLRNFQIMLWFSLVWSVTNAEGVKDLFLS